jgi:hypothetical protein
MTVAISGFSPQIAAIIQDRTLVREFYDALFPNLLYRMEAKPESWPANIGDTQVFTRAGLIEVDTNPLTPGQDPTVGSYDVEQWTATADQYGKSVDTHMPTSFVSLASTFMLDLQKLGLHAGRTMNRLARDPLYRAYLGGRTVTIQAALAGALQIVVANINGFSQVQAGGSVAPVSALNPMPISFDNGVTFPNTVVGATPLDPADPFGPGILTLGAVLAGPLALRDGVLSQFAAELVRVGGGATIDAFTGTEILTLQTIINAVANLRDANVPTFEDGMYHCHLSPQGEAQIFADNQFQRLNQSLPDDVRYRELIIGDLVGVRFYRNRENPNQTNVGTLINTSGGAGPARGSDDIGAEVINAAGVPVRRAIVMGAGAVYEKYIPEATAYMSEAGVQGKLGTFSIVNNGVQVMTERIRYILRSPQDRLQQVVSQSWSWSGDFPVPSDGVTGTAATFKRAIVIEHA